MRADSPRPLHGLRTLCALALLIVPLAHGQVSAGAEPLDIIVFGASGRVGSRIATEALNRGHRVTGVSRSLERLTETHERYTKVQRDVMDPASIAGFVSGFDAVVSAIGGNNPDSEDPADSYPARAGLALIAALGQLGAEAPRFIVVGGGSTTLESSPGVRIEDETDIPTGSRGARILGHRIVLDALKDVSEFRWTFASPALTMSPGERTGIFRIGGSVVIRDDQGESRISMEDFAVALVDELEDPQHIGRQMTVAY